MNALPDACRRAFVKAAFWIPLTLCMVVALTPSPSGLPASLSGFAGHAAAFAYLAVALFPAHFRNGPVLAVALWLFSFGVWIEVAQLFVAGRSGDLLDLAFDALGIAVGCAIYRSWQRFKAA